MVWANEDENPFPYFILGFPDFGHLVNASHRQETLSTVALPAYVRQLEDHVWDGYGERAPQLILEADADPESVRGDSPMQMEVAMRLFRPTHEGDREPLGGLSGGPIVVVGQDGEFLLGVTKGRDARIRRTYSSCWKLLGRLLHRVRTLRREKKGRKWIMEPSLMLAGGRRMVETVQSWMPAGSTFQDAEDLLHILKQLMRPRLSWSKAGLLHQRHLLPAHLPGK